MKTLYCVQVEFYGEDTVVVAADDHNEARRIAIDAADDSDLNVTANVDPIEKLEDVPEDWLDEFPWGDNENKTCSDWFTRKLLDDAPEPTDTLQLCLGEKPTRTTADSVDQKCREYACLLAVVRTEQYTPEELDRCCTLANDHDVQRRLETARQREIHTEKPR